MTEDQEKIRHHLQNLILINRAEKQFRDQGGHIAHYERPNQKTLVVVVRQTYPQKIGDIANVTHIALTGLPNLPRLLSTFNQIRELKQKYPDHKIDIAGWSAGGLEAQLFSAMANNSYGYNPGTTINHLTNNRMYPNLEIVKTETDVVSAYPTLGTANITSIKSPFLQHNLNGILEHSVNQQLELYDKNGDIENYTKLKNIYQDYAKKINDKDHPLDYQKKTELLQKMFPVLRDEVEKTNNQLASLEYKFREQQQQQMIIKMKQHGLGDGQTYYNQHYVKYWSHRSPAQDVHQIGNYLKQYLPQDKYVRIGYDLALNIFSKSVMTGKSWDKAFQFDKLDVNAVGNFMQAVLPHILPKELNDIVQKGQMARKFAEDSVRLYALSQKTMLSMAMKTEMAHLGMAIANTIISLLPVPKQVKSIFSLATSLSYMTFLLASGGPIIPIILAALAILSALGDLGVGCNKGGGGGGGGKGNKQSKGQQGNPGSGGGGGGNKGNNNQQPQQNQQQNQNNNGNGDFYDLFNNMNAANMQVNGNGQNNQNQGNIEGGKIKGNVTNNTHKGNINNLQVDGDVVGGKHEGESKGNKINGKVQQQQQQDRKGQDHKNNKNQNQSKQPNQQNNKDKQNQKQATNTQNKNKQKNQKQNNNDRDKQDQNQSQKPPDPENNQKNADQNDKDSKQKQKDIKRQQQIKHPGKEQTEYNKQKQVLDKQKQRKQKQQRNKGKDDKREQKQKLPTLTQIPLKQDQPLQQPDPDDTQKQSFYKFIRNFAKKLFRGNELMSAQEARQKQREQGEQSDKELNKDGKQKKERQRSDFGRQLDDWQEYEADKLNGDGQNKDKKEEGGGGQQQKKKNKVTEKVTFETQMWISDFTKNKHQGEKQHLNQQKQFQKLDDKSDQPRQKQTIGINKNMKKKVNIIQMADVVPEKSHNSKNQTKTDEEIVSKGKYFTKERLKEFDDKKYRKAAKYVKGKDEIITKLQKEQDTKKKDKKQTLVKFKNLNMNKESGKVTEYKDSDKKVLIPDSYFAEEADNEPQLIRQKQNRRVSKGVINPNLKGNYTINTFDFFNNLQVDRASSINLALPSELLFLAENQLDILFYQKYYENSLLGYERLEQSIQKQQEDNRKKAGLAHLSHEQLRYKILGEREQYDQYTTGGTYQIISQEQIVVDTTKTYVLSGQFRTKHPMRLMVGFICYNYKKQLIPGYQVFKKGQYVTFKSFNKNTQQISVEGNLNNWNSFPRDKKLKDRFLGFYIEGDTTKNPDFTIICDNDPLLQSPEQSGFTSVDPGQKIITLSKYAVPHVPNNLKPGVSKLANQVYQSQAPTLICVDIKNIEPSLAYTEIVVEITGEGREFPKPWKNNQTSKSVFWPETAYVQVVIYTNWFGNPKRQEKGETIWRNIHFGQKQ